MSTEKEETMLDETVVTEDDTEAADNGYEDEDGEKESDVVEIESGGQDEPGDEGTGEEETGEESESGTLSGADMEKLSARVAELEKRAGTGNSEDIFIRDFRMIKNAYPNIKETSVHDLGREFFRLMSSGNFTAVQAYELTHMDDIRRMAREEGKSRALENRRSKEHMKAESKGTGGKAVIIPRDVLRMFRDLNPDKSDKEIARYYAKKIKEEE